MIGRFLGKFRGWLIGAGAVILAILGAYGKGRRDNNQKREAEETRRRVEAIEKKKDIEDEVDSDDITDLRDSLRPKRR